MNPRVYRWQLGIILLGMFALIPAALAQTAPTIDEKDKIANSVAREKVLEFIEFHAKALGGEDADARTQSRDALLAGGVAKTGSPAYSPGYLDVYADVLNKSLKPLATNPSMVVRLNVAIVAAKVARSADNTRLIETVQVLLTDKTEGVQLWALRAAVYILPAELRVSGGAKNDKLIPAIVQLAKQKTSGSIVNEAYNALSLNYTDREKLNTIPANIKTEMFSAVIPHIHSILKDRVAAYAAGTVTEPGAERDAAKFLTNSTVWGLQDAKLKTATLQALLDVIDTGSKAAQKNVGKNMEMVQAIRDTARAMLVPFLTAPEYAAVRRALEQIGEAQNMKPWEQVPALTAELMKIDKNVKPTSAPTSAPAGK